MSEQPAHRRSTVRSLETPDEYARLSPFVVLDVRLRRPAGASVGPSSPSTPPAPASVHPEATRDA